MKQLFCILIAVITLGKVSAQPYIPMLGNITEWHAVTCLNGCGVDAYNSSGDTLVDGQHYQTLGGFHYIQGNFLIREDFQERKVYMKLLVAHTLLDEYPLYDFSLNDGDTTHIYNPISPLPEDGGLFVLDSIIARPLETGLHRHFYLHAVDPVASQSETTVWIEGVGSLSLINSPGAGPTGGEHLGCSFKDGILQYAALDSISSCYTSINEPVESQKPQTTLAPSLFNDQVTLKSGVLKGEYQLDVYSSDGRLILTKNHLKVPELILATTDFPPGPILFMLRYADGTLSYTKGIRLKQD